MSKLAVIAIFVLIASCLSTAQTTSSTPAANASATKKDNGTGEIPTFRAQARQVLVTVAVWKHGPSSAAWIPKETLEQYPDLPSYLAMPPVARGLTTSDFHVFDNGAEQKINYLQESDLPMRDVNEQWFFYPQSRGTWGKFLDLTYAFTAPIATYTLGYTPALSQSSDCHTIRVAVKDGEVVTNRAHYCTADHPDPAIAERSQLAERMEQFAKSGKQGTFKVSSRPFVFWSSRVLSLMSNDPSNPNRAAASTAATKPHVVHGSSAQATVQIATEYDLGELGMTNWSSPCPPNAAIHVLGIVYKSDGKVAARFGDSYSCVSGGSSSQFLMDFGWDGTVGAYNARWVLIPTRFNSQVQLRPGDYDVHVVVSDGQQFGETRMPLHVEALDSNALTISDLALDGILRDASWLVRDAGLISPAPLVPSPLVSKHAQFIPVPDSRIPQNSSLPLYFEIYEPLLAEESPQVYFRMKITGLKHGKVITNTDPTSAAPCVTAGNVVIPVALNVETGKLPKGEYRLEVQATDSAGRKTEWKQGTFTVE